jgi:hypothetical protein
MLDEKLKNGMLLAGSFVDASRGGLSAAFFIFGRSLSAFTGLIPASCYIYFYPL